MPDFLSKIFCFFELVIEVDGSGWASRSPLIQSNNGIREPLHDSKHVVFNSISLICNKMRKYKPAVLKVLIFLMLLSFLAIVHSIYSSIHCDFEEGKALIETPQGSFIKKFDSDQPVKKFSLLSNKCDYENERLQCPDIRFKGETMLRQVQLATVRMVVAFDKICRKHGITYWLWRGALLGAYRHKGFIPWDNEVDIGMTEENYEKFRLFSRDLPADIFLQNASSDPEYGKAKHTIIAKLRDRKGCFGYCLRTGCRFHDGLMVDIFGFRQNGRDSIVETTNNKVKYNVRKSDVFPLKEMEFEGYNFFVPNKYDVILANSYGQDYYKLPLQSSRCPSGQLIGLPWFACSDLERMKTSLRTYYLYSSIVSKMKLLSWYM